MKTCLRNFYFDLAFSPPSSQQCATADCYGSTAGIEVCHCFVQSAEFVIEGELYCFVARERVVATLAKAKAKASLEVSWVLLSEQGHCQCKVSETFDLHLVD